MKKFLSVLALLLLIVQGSYAQKKFSAYGVAFYNQENLLTHATMMAKTTMISCLPALTVGTA